MKKRSATAIGLITGVLMILLSLGIFYYKGNFDNGLQYIVYAIYVAGILWTLNSYHRTVTDVRNFKAYFSQGFKCFIVVTLLMVLFTWSFLKLNPGLETEMAQNYRLDLVKKGNYTTPEIEKMVAEARKSFVVVLTSVSIFGYLVIGALITTVTSLFFSRYKKN